MKEGQNITLIGMAGVGKSMGGAALAQSLDWDFIDIDKRLVERYKKPLQEMLDSLGDENFIRLEGQGVLELGDIVKTVVAPGGSIVYSPKAMEFLKRVSTVVYLHDAPEVIQARIDVRSRGIVGLKGKTFAELYAERVGLYRAAADLTIDAHDKAPGEIAEEIRSHVNI